MKSAYLSVGLHTALHCQTGFSTLDIRMCDAGIPNMVIVFDCEHRSPTLLLSTRGSQSEEKWLKGWIVVVQELKESVSDKGWPDGLHKGLVKYKWGNIFKCQSCKSALKLLLIDPLTNAPVKSRVGPDSSAKMWDSDKDVRNCCFKLLLVVLPARASLDCFSCTVLQHFGLAFLK